MPQDVVKRNSFAYLLTQSIAFLLAARWMRSNASQDVAKRSSSTHLLTQSIASRLAARWSSAPLIAPHP